MAEEVEFSSSPSFCVATSSADRSLRIFLKHKKGTKFCVVPKLLVLCQRCAWSLANFAFYFPLTNIVFVYN